MPTELPNLIPYYFYRRACIPATPQYLLFSKHSSQTWTLYLKYLLLSQHPISAFKVQLKLDFCEAVFNFWGQNESLPPVLL